MQHGNQIPVLDDLNARMALAGAASTLFSLAP